MQKWEFGGSHRTQISIPNVAKVMEGYAKVDPTELKYTVKAMGGCAKVKVKLHKMSRCKKVQQNDTRTIPFLINI